MDIIHQIGTILIVNILSILCIPIFLFSQALRMLSVIVRKFIFFPVLVSVILVFTFIYFVVYSGAVFQSLFYIVAIFIIGGLIIGIMIFLYSIASTLIMTISLAVAEILDAAGNAVSDFYVYLLDIIEAKLRFTDLMKGNVIKKVLITIFCLPFLFHCGLYFIVKTIIKYCVFLGVAASIGIIVKAWLSFNAESMNVVGVSFVKLITMFDLRDSIMNWIQLLGGIGIQVAVIMFVCIEWSLTAIELEEKDADDSLKDSFGSLMNINM